MDTYAARIRRRYGATHYVGKEMRDAGLVAIAKYKRTFPFRPNIDHTAYAVRKVQRYHFVADKLREFCTGDVLDVGSRNATLSELLGKPCAFVDKNNPDLPPFDWEKETLPFEDDSFDTVVCLDVLEHIDRFHEAFADLLRVSRRHVIISLPNNWKKAFREFVWGRGHYPGYGLPPEKPLDRHRWFFNTEDAEDFMFYHAGVDGCAVRAVRYHMPVTIPRNQLLYPLLGLFLPERHFKNLFVDTVFFVLEKS